MEEEFEEINQFNKISEEIDKNDRIAVNNLIDKLRSCCSCKNSCIEKVVPSLLQSLVLEIEYRFQIKGHTRNSVDHRFGLTKQKYARSEVWCMNQLAEVIEKSASNNMPVNLENQIGLFRD
ncbi:9797_t:CDS:2 [Racocetra fulgida]|uniref:9797_t:CDS:1 n=1 Tax=Racocetra fulgida TaxID=60492 RepID=A0A9N9C744_9GLOM|nr:9797_t:CDS:2 [Racocetra fulgida]